jgi:hypothetical protein
VRRLLATLTVLPVVLLAACGDDGAEPLDTPPASTESPSTTAPAPTSTSDGGTFEYATGADDVVIGVTFEGGLVPSVAFSTTPVAIVSGDGRVLTTGPTTMQFPGRLLPNVLQQSITEDGIEELLAGADELGLLAEVDYPSNDNIADAPSTVVTITVGGTTYSHAAYALDLEPETDPSRRALSDFVALMTDLSGTLGDAVGAEAPYVTDTYLVQAEVIDPATMTFEVEPTIVDWPPDAPVRLADVGECAEVPAAAVDSVFADATQLTFFTEADVTYQVSVVPKYAGRAC